MKLRVLAATMLAAAVPAAAAAHPIRHRPGCRTHACDRRVDRWWGKHHRLRAQASSTGATAVASWYDDNGPLACPWAKPRDGMGIASLIVACGSRVRLCHEGRCVTATVDDHGPYIAGRTFDLNEEVKGAIGCGDLCSVWYVRRDEAEAAAAQ